MEEINDSGKGTNLLSVFFFSVSVSVLSKNIRNSHLVVSEVHILVCVVCAKTCNETLFPPVSPIGKCIAI